jgi:hypothetical protein
VYRRVSRFSAVEAEPARVGAAQMKWKPNSGSAGYFLYLRIMLIPFLRKSVSQLAKLLFLFPVILCPVFDCKGNKTIDCLFDDLNILWQSDLFPADFDGDAIVSIWRGK